jgi:hypothetical protein
MFIPGTKSHDCCAAGRTDSGRHFRTVVECVLPGAVLVLIPKCPLCIVAYVAMFTGLGLSVSTAADLRIGLVIICCISIILLVFRSIHRAFAKDPSL